MPVCFGANVCTAIVTEILCSPGNLSRLLDFPQAGRCTVTLNISLHCDHLLFKIFPNEYKLKTKGGQSSKDS